MIASVLHGLDVLLHFLAALGHRLLVLAQLGDEVLLVGDLVAQGPDLAVLGLLQSLLFLKASSLILHWWAFMWLLVRAYDPCSPCYSGRPAA